MEFVVQTLQFIHGARHAFLQEPSTLKALRALAELELLPLGQVRALDQAYRFLRRVEHRLQIEAEQQTHSIPDDLTKRERLARSLGFASADLFLSELHNHTQRVREIFQDLIASQNDKARRILQFKKKRCWLRLESKSGFRREFECRVETCDAHAVTLCDDESYL